MKGLECQHFLWPLPLMAVASCLAGCEQGPPLAVAGGVVRHEGTPLSGGKIVFLSADRKPSAVGTIEPDGSFLLSTEKKGDGAHAGRYRVTVVTDLQIGGREAHVTCQPPRNFLLQVEMDRENQFDIDVRPASGWKVLIDD